jgi:glycosyltransferase involved in cell wall biosynthesis
MARVSIIIPTINETSLTLGGITVLQKTVQDIYEKATGDFEVIVGFDGPPYEDLPSYPNLKIMRHPERIGLKKNVNTMAKEATGKYLYKSDAHCMFDKGFDEKLQADMQDNWLVTPRFYVLNANNWTWQDERFYDYFYLYYPFYHPNYLKFKAGGHWPEKSMEKLNVLVDETPQFHGSGWFISKTFFLDFLGGMNTDHPLSHAQEPPDLGLKTWLGPWGGKVMVNKKTWYAHMHKGYRRPLGWTIPPREIIATYHDSACYWMGNKWEKRIHDIEWFIDKFMPMPTWPENWREVYAKWKSGQPYM